MHCFLNIQNNTWIKGEESKETGMEHPLKAPPSSYLPGSPNARAPAPLTGANTWLRAFTIDKRQVKVTSCHCGGGVQPPLYWLASWPPVLSHWNLCPAAPQPAFSRHFPPPLLELPSSKLFRLLHQILAACPTLCPTPTAVLSWAGQHQHTSRGFCCKPIW